jgi:hypothetical protein
MDKQRQSPRDMSHKGGPQQSHTGQQAKSGQNMQQGSQSGQQMSPPGKGGQSSSHSGNK